ncbi:MULTISPECIES: cytochrome P450 [Streptomyces]|uniref:Cytochrome P450 n=2 Tax=Streptomyces rimosus subsp. rimosus TaxID=132474 RepID=L8ESY4_STRR1|nr:MULTISPECIES: cytochrome P450 [Streptomyces]KOG72450.1 cytochrome P450 [Kitasatospora aureofaciens]MYT42862.1 cytochrome P450 [Streptomyces sp. SID5471]KEF05286.1 cytochrome P450 [Streptomyces rimosus]KEF18931.1 cytochrome P450 [Streptomyces rimosus]KOT31467.1 cytochrome P450 [Streptomyces rimosus subsp. rimosus]
MSYNPTAPDTTADGTTGEPPTLPTDRRTGCPFDPPGELTALSDRPLRRMRYADGHIGWLATGHAAARAVLSDPRFSSRYELLHLPVPMPGMEGMTAVPPAPTGDFLGLDAPEHTRYRRLLTGKFTVRRMRQLSERVEQFTHECLDAMEQAGPTVDLVEAFARPVPALMICELLGVPYADRDRFQEHVATLFDQAADAEARGAAFAAVGRFMGELVAAKRAEPTDDLLSDLTTSDLTEEELIGVGGVLLAAGLDTTANMLGLGTFALLSNPDQLDALRADPGLAGQTVEELLRYLSVADPIPRAALEDVEIEGRLVRAGETVTVSVQAANRDPLKFPDPDRFDIHRKATGHVSFGHGPHQCLGQQLARVEMTVAFPALFARFPTLRLAVPPQEVPLRDRANIYGVISLPVTWDKE